MSSRGHSTGALANVSAACCCLHQMKAAASCRNVWYFKENLWLVISAKEPWVMQPSRTSFFNKITMSITIIIILSTKFLRTCSAWQRTPTGLSHTRGCVEVSEPLRDERQWDSDSYNVWGNAKFASSMYKHTPMAPFCYGTIYIRISSHEASRILQNSGTIFYVVHTQYS